MQNHFGMRPAAWPGCPRAPGNIRGIESLVADEGRL